MFRSTGFQTFAILTTVVSGVMLWGCQTELSPIPVTTRIVIDNSIPMSEQFIDGLDGGPPRSVGAVMASDGSVDEFVIAEVVYRPDSDEQLDAFLKKYDGVVLRDGTYPAPEGVEDSSFASSGFYLIRINADTAPKGDIDDRIAETGIEGTLNCTSDQTARTLAAALREDNVSLNYLYETLAVNEHPDFRGTPIDAGNFFWMTEDNDPSTPDEDGLSIGVVHAWEYLRYINLPPDGRNGSSTTWSPANVAIIDRGFALDSTTGLPLNDNQDYFYYGNNGPVQYDFNDNDNRAGADESRWHGQSAFGICCARPRNRYGTAGTGGSVVIPMIFRTGRTAYSLADSIRFAGIWGADVVSISMGRECGTLCNQIEDPNGHVQRAVYTATGFGAVVLAAAGNGNNTTDLSDDISDIDLFPCKLDTVICVGAIGQDKKNVHNHGDGVDIWAPTNLRTTVNPDTAGNVGISALKVFGGTSCATPFVAGIVGMMKTVNPDLRWDDVQQILQDTSNSSPDPKVRHGYVDAFRAVLAVGPENFPPTVTMISPTDGATRSWARQVSFRAEAIDPEYPDFFDGKIEFFSDRSGKLCTAPCSFENRPLLPMGVHVITAVADDGHGGVTTSAPITIEITNDAPIAEIRGPANNTTAYADQSINFRGYAFDWDETIFDHNMFWTSNIDGDIGQGRDLAVTLSPGAHVIKLTAIDAKNETAEAEISLTVLAGVGIPSARVESPDAGFLANSSYVWTFNAIASDPEDGPLTGDSVKWYSDVDGLLGTGEQLQTTLSGSPDSCGAHRFHIITMEVTDSDGNTTSDQITVTVGVIC